MFGINTTRDISKLSQISLDAREITHNNFEISLQIISIIYSNVDFVLWETEMLIACNITN